MFALDEVMLGVSLVHVGLATKIHIGSAKSQITPEAKEAAETPVVTVRLLVFIPNPD